MSAIDIIILAAGKGTRMRSELPKVLHRLAGKPLITHVLDAASALADGRITVVAGHGMDLVQGEIENFQGELQQRTKNSCPIKCIEQKEQLGSGHAVQQAIPGLDNSASTALVLYGDVPLLDTRTLERMLVSAAQGKLTLLTVVLSDPSGYGRILRDSADQVIGIVEQKDASVDQLAIAEINTGIMAMPVTRLKEWLPQLSNDNAQGEYYLTDIVALAAQQKMVIETLHPESIEEVEGVNNRSQLARLERYYQARQAETLMEAGVALADPARFDCRGSITAGRDVFIDINCVFAGEVALGDGVSIGPNCSIANATIGDGAIIKANTVIEGPVTIEAGVQVGPFARLREGTVLRKHAKVGNFVEIKKTELGEGSKASHLSYLGDTRLGKDVNVGAGTITCNYDGVNKHRTDIGDNVFVGSNSSLVAPVAIGEGATIGAGSTITRDVPPSSLSVARGKQKTIEGWQRPEKKGPEKNSPEKREK
ncbi:MAG: bifunctional UDP-N-acetylglucosamine diphosphorylase/glucosamine-1-phosphate N-acetyltransferase GlmU [Porticoccaceae bacterium]